MDLVHAIYKSISEETCRWKLILVFDTFLIQTITKTNFAKGKKHEDFHN